MIRVCVLPAARARSLKLYRLCRVTARSVSLSPVARIAETPLGLTGRRTEPGGRTRTTRLYLTSDKAQERVREISRRVSSRGFILGVDKQQLTRTLAAESKFT